MTIARPHREEIFRNSFFDSRVEPLVVSSHAEAVNLAALIARPTDRQTDRQRGKERLAAVKSTVISAQR
jgi:hypothetical protein